MGSNYGERLQPRNEKVGGAVEQIGVPRLGFGSLHIRCDLAPDYLAPLLFYVNKYSTDETNLFLCGAFRMHFPSYYFCNKILGLDILYFLNFHKCISDFKKS